MDFIKGAIGGGNKDQKASGSSGDKQQNQDYVDKAFDFASKKAGHDFNPQTDEKITDAARSAYEKATGKKVSDKISN